MSNSFYNVTSNPAYNSSLDSSLIRSEYAAIATGFDKLPTLSGNGYKIVSINYNGTQLIATPNVTIDANGDLNGTTQLASDSSTKMATTAYVTAKSFSSSLPGQGGQAGKVITTDGTNASWSLIGTAGQGIRVNAGGTALEGYALSSGDASTNTASSIDSEVAVFSGTAGKTLKRATGSGLAKLTSGVLSVATAATDYAPATTGSAILKASSGGFAAATANTDYLAQFYKSAGAIVVDKGNISAATVTFDYSAGSVQTYTATGSTVTWAVSNWPPTGNEGYLLIRATNQGAYTLAATLVTNWIKPDGTTTGTMSTYLAANTGRTALQTSGVDQILLWTRDAGSVVFGKLV